MSGGLVGRVEQLLELAGKATPRPWSVSRGSTFNACELRAPDPYNGFALVRAATNEPADFDLVVAAVNLVEPLTRVALAAQAYVDYKLQSKPPTGFYEWEELRKALVAVSGEPDEEVEGE